MSQQNNGQNGGPAKDPEEPAATAKPSLISDDPMVATGSDAGPAEGAGGEAEAAAGEAPPEPQTPEQQIEILHGQLAEVENARLRAMADNENLRKRMERDIASAHKFAVSSFAADIVPLLDSFQRAKSSVTPQDVEKDPALKGLLDGVTMAEKQFLSVLERHGIERVDPKNEPFNPHFHQAIAQLQNPDIPAGTIMEVAQPGFVIEDRVIRPAMVVVAQGGVKPVRPVKLVEPEPPEAEMPVPPARVPEPVQPAPEPAADPGRQPAAAENDGESRDAPPTEDLEAIAREVIARSRLGGGAGRTGGSGGGARTGGKGTARSATKPKRA